MPTWILYALAAAAFAAMVNIFGKLGMKDVNQDFATAVRSVVQAVFVVGFAAVIGQLKNFGQLNRASIASIVAAGVCGGLSWICAFRALHLADASKVGPVDKLSVPLAVLLAVIFLGERPTIINWSGVGMIAIGAYLAALN